MIPAMSNASSCGRIEKSIPSSFVSTYTVCGFRLADSIHDDGTHIDLGLELRDGLHGTRSDEDLATFHLFTLDTAEESPHVVACLALGCIKVWLAGNLDKHLLGPTPYGTSLITVSRWFGERLVHPHRCQ